MKKNIYIVKGYFKRLQWVVGVYTSKKRAKAAIQKCVAEDIFSRYYFYPYVLNR